jgi:hypothetical protein
LEDEDEEEEKEEEEEEEDEAFLLKTPTFILEPDSLLL